MVLGAVNYSDPALQARLGQQFCRVVSLAQVQPETRNSRRVEKLLVPVAHPWAHAAPLGWIAPVARGGHRAGIRAEADEQRFFAEPLAHELANVQFAALALEADE